MNKIYFTVIVSILTHIIFIISLPPAKKKPNFYKKQKVKVIISQKPQPKPKIKKTKTKIKKQQKPIKRSQPKPIISKPKIKKVPKLPPVGSSSISIPQQPIKKTPPLSNTQPTSEGSQENITDSDNIDTNSQSDSSYHKVDLSKRAQLKTFVKPQYTQDALDEELEGKYSVNVFIDAKGKVTQAQLTKKIGSDMDQRIIKASLDATFSPRTNSKGKAIAGWDIIIIILHLP